MVDSRSVRNSPSRLQRDIMRRFQPTGDADSNLRLANDPEAMDMVPEEVQEEVHYNRPPFNWPGPSIPQANYFAIEAMALDVLRKSGHKREARSLQARLDNAIPTFDELPGVLHRVLDFAPAAALPPDKLSEMKALAEQMGLDPDSLGVARKKPVRNPLEHSCKTAKEEWQWLVEHAKVESCFGKTAACELSPSMISHLVALWLPALGQDSKGDPEDPSFCNRAWFDANFPMGWLHLDHLHETACVSAPMGFEDRVSLLAYEMASKMERGWAARSVAHIGYDHKSELGVTGSALIGMDAFDFFESSLVGSKPVGSASASALKAHLLRCNPELSSISDKAAVWAAYRLADPANSGFVEDSAKEAYAGKPSEPGSRDAEYGKRLARHEQLILSIPTDLSLTLGAASPSHGEPRELAQAKARMRL